MFNMRERAICMKVSHSAAAGWPNLGMTSPRREPRRLHNGAAPSKQRSRFETTTLVVIKTSFECCNTLNKFTRVT